MTLETLKTTLAQGGKHLGDLVWWTLSDAAIERTALMSNWAAAGLDPQLLPDPPSAERSLRVAVKEAGVGHPQLLIRLGRDDEASMIFGVVREERGADGNLTYHQEARVTLNKETGQLITDLPEHEVVRAITSAFEHYKATHTADEVRRMMVRTLHSHHAVCLREGGGIYWAPRTSSETVRKLQGCIQGIGRSRLHLIPVHESGEGTHALGEVAKASLEQELADLQIELMAFQNEPPKRQSTLTNRIEAFEALRSRAQLYQSILAVNVETIEAGVKAMATVVESMLMSSAA